MSTSKAKHSRSHRATAGQTAVHLPALPNNSADLATAECIGTRLCRDAIWDRDRCNWIGSSMEFIDHTWAATARSFGPDLYSGTSGIALFLGRLFEVTGVVQFRKTAAGAQAISPSHDLPAIARLGFYSGGAGIAHVLTELGGSLDRADWIARGLQIIEELAKTDSDQDGIDVISGSAGAIPLFLHIYARSKLPVAMDLALRHGARLLKIAQRQKIGWAWDTLPGVTRPLTGFSHGAGGIAWSLLELHAATGQAAFRQGGIEGLRYEQQWFDPTTENWPDFRDHAAMTMPGMPAPRGPVFSTAWCHGSPGIGLSRLRAWQLTSDSSYLGQANAAIRSTLRSLSGPASFYSSQCLCHGSLGNAELLLAACEMLGERSHDAVLTQLADRSMDLFEKTNSPWPCGVNGGGETPGLMLREVIVQYTNRKGEIGRLRLLTDLLDPSTGSGRVLSASAVAELYRQRWKIELFFRWLKVSANFRHLCSHGKNGISPSFHMAVIAALLMVLRTGRPLSIYGCSLLSLVAVGQADMQNILPILEQREGERRLEHERLAASARQTNPPETAGGPAPANSGKLPHAQNQMPGIQTRRDLRPFLSFIGPQT